MEKQNLTTYTELSSERLVLRALALTDREQMAAIRSDASVNKYISRQVCLSLAEADAFIRKIQLGVLNEGWFYWAICLKEDARLIGTACLWNIDLENAQAELGYELFPALQGKGIMSEALEKVIGFAFNELRFNRIIAITNQNNHKSLGLLKRFGFVADPAARDTADFGEDDLMLVLSAASRP